MTFMDLMSRVFTKYVEIFLIMFIDDTLIYSRSEDKHTMVFICHIVYEKNIEVDPKKTNVVKSRATPLSHSNIRNF